MATLPIIKALEISTAHITKETNYKLESAFGYLRRNYSVYDLDCGYIIFVNHDDNPEYPLPDDLKACLQLAKENDCVWLILDADATCVDELPKYEW